MFNVKELDSLELQSRMADEGQNLKLIDVRSPEEFAQGTVPGAVNIPLHLLPMRINEVPSEPTVIFCCRSGARSAQACAFAASQGKANTYNLRGGLIGWVQNGLAVA